VEAHHNLGAEPMEAPMAAPRGCIASEGAPLSTSDGGGGAGGGAGGFQDQLDSCKTKIKQWESEFERRHGRQPVHDDVRASEG